MKIRKLSIIIGCLCILSFIGIFCFENHLLNIPSKESGNHADSIDLENFSVGHEEDEVITNTVLYMDNLSIEVLSCEMIEDVDIENQTTYTADCFSTGEIPDSEYMEEYRDTEKIKEVCPELKDMWENNENYSFEEIDEIYKRNLDVIEQYTYMRHPKTRYYFVKCRITNLLEKKNETSLSLDTFISSNESEYLEIHEYAVYFDKSMFTTPDERQHKFFWYEFEAGEVLECILGFEIKEQWNETEQYYLGVQQPGMSGYTLKNTQLVPLTEAGISDE